MTPTLSPPRWRQAALAAAVLLGCSIPLSALADDRAEIERLRATTQALIDTLVGQGLLTRERADAIVRQAAAAAAPARPALPADWGSPPRGVAGPPAPGAAGAAGAVNGVIRVPYISDTLRAQLRDEIRYDVLSTAREEGWADPRQIPPWTKALKFSGDLRLRAQAERYAQPLYAVDPTTGLQLGDACAIVGGNLPARCYRRQTQSPAWAPDLSNTSTARDRLTLRARLGLSAKLSSDLSADLRLSTGSTSGPTSSSQTLGTHFNKGTLVIDRAFVRWEPRYDIRLLAGRMPNPFFSTDLTWTDDLSFDGIAAQGDVNLAPGTFAFANAGVFPLQEQSLDTRDKWLYAVQAGASWAFNDAGNLRVGLAVYDFARVEGVRETSLPPTGERAGTEPYLSTQYPATVRLKGNTLINLNDATSTAAPTWGLASKFRPINLTAQLDYRLFTFYQLGASLDWVRNTGFDLADIRQRAGTTALDDLAERTSGLQARLQYGTLALANAGDWRVSAAYRRFERDAWIDGFTDTTWHLGGTNYKGWQVGAQYAFDSKAVLGLRLTSSRNLDDGQRSVNTTTGAVESSYSNAPLKLDVLQFDLSTRF